MQWHGRTCASTAHCHSLSLSDTPLFVLRPGGEGKPKKKKGEGGAKKAGGGKKGEGGEKKKKKPPAAS